MIVPPVAGIASPSAPSVATTAADAAGAAPIALDSGSFGGVLVVVGLFLLAGFLAHVIGRRAHVPRVTLLLVLGVLAGPGGLGLAPAELASWFPAVAQVALSIIGFELGERFLRRELRRTGRVVLGVAFGVTLVTSAVVAVVLVLAGMPLVTALLLAGIAPSTAPAASVDVIREVRARGPLTDCVLGVVAVDDAIGVILFSLLAVAASIVGAGHADAGVGLVAFRELGGGVLVGGLFGLPMAYLTGRVREGEPTRLETLGFVLLASGAASIVGASPLVAALTQGAVVANLARHHVRPFHAIRNVRDPFLVIFFILAGLQFEPGELRHLGPLAVAYVLSRTAGRLAGGTLAARAVRAPTVVVRHVGWCLLPQAGVALGLALLAAEQFPGEGDRILTLLVGTTFLFEVAGPIATRLALARAGESGSADDGDAPEDDDDDDDDRRADTHRRA